MYSQCVRMYVRDILQLMAPLMDRGHAGSLLRIYAIYSIIIETLYHSRSIVDRASGMMK